MEGRSKQPATLPNQGLTMFFFSESPNNTLPADHPRTPCHFLSAVFITFDYLAYPQKTPTAGRRERLHADSMAQRWLKDHGKTSTSG